MMVSKFLLLFVCGMIGFLSNPAAAIGSCSRCRLFSERMYRYNFDTDECTDRCFLFARRGVNQGFKCGTCEDAGANDIDTTKFNTQLDLSNVGATEQQAFIDASKRWDEVITGDLLTVSGASVRDFSLCGESIPTLNDDIFVCANSSTLDGPGGVLAFASPEYVRSEEVSRDVGFPTVGVIKIDADDIEPLKSAGLFEKLVEKSFGVVYGLTGLTLSDRFFDLIDENCTYKVDSIASSEFQNISGCGADVPIPVASSTNDTDLPNLFEGLRQFCDRWDESCLQTELMTELLNSSSDEISRMTVGALEDMGYEVDFNAADDFGQEMLNPDCVCDVEGRRNKSRRSLQEQVLSPDDSGLQAAVTQGQAFLEKMAGKSSTNGAAFRGGDSDGGEVQYVGGSFVLVMYQDDNGNVRSISLQG